MVTCYGQILSGLCPSGCLDEEWAKWQNILWGPRFVSEAWMLLRFRGRFPWWGSFGSSVPRSPGATLQRSGVAHGPLHPAVFFSKLCCSCVCSLVRDLESCSGNLYWSVALGFLSCFGCLLSIGPVRFFVFLVLGSLGGGASSRWLFF